MGGGSSVWGKGRKHKRLSTTYYNQKPAQAFLIKFLVELALLPRLFNPPTLVGEMLRVGEITSLPASLTTKANKRDCIFLRKGDTVWSEETCALATPPSFQYETRYC